MADDTPTGGFSAEERAAMRQRAKELRASQKAADQLADAVTAIEAMDADERAIAEGVHAIALEVAPQLAPRTWYGFPAYAKDGKVVVFFQPGSKFKTRYNTLGFNDSASLDDGEMWPTSYAITALTPEVEERVRELVRRAAG